MSDGSATSALTGSIQLVDTQRHATFEKNKNDINRWNGPRKNSILIYFHRIRFPIACWSKLFSWNWWKE